MTTFKSWTPEEELWLLKNKTLSMNALVEHLGRTSSSIRKKIARLEEENKIRQSNLIQISLPKYEKQITLPIPPQEDKRADDYAYLTVSDIHIGYIDDHGHSINDEVKEKLDNYRDNVLHLLKYHNPVKHFRLLFLGDMIQGQENYDAQKDDSQPISIQLSEAINILYHWLIPFLDTLYSMGIQTDIYCIAGNHGRTSKYRSDVKDNFDLTIYNWLRAAITDRYKGLNFYIDPETLLIKEGGKTIAVEHGDKVRGLSLASMQKRIMNVSGMYRTILDAYVMGHWHTAGDLYVGNTRLIMSGTLQGETDLSNAMGILPQENWYFFSTKGGHWGFTYRIDYRPRNKGKGSVMSNGDKNHAKA